MRETPECLNNRYKALDELIKQLSIEPTNTVSCTDQPGIRLMCDFWNILQEDPNVDLAQAVQQRMEVNRKRCCFGPQQYNCFMAGCCNKKNEDEKKPESPKPKKHDCSKHTKDRSKLAFNLSKSTQPSSSGETLPLNKVLCNLKEAASFEKKCEARVDDLLERQKILQEQIQMLEEKEKEGVQKLREADNIWSCMEECYKKKIAESLERQKDLLKQLKEAEASNIKWRKNKKDLEFQLNNINKCHQEINGKINEKMSDIKCMDMEINNFKNRIESNKKDIEVAKKSLNSKKQASDARIANTEKEVIQLEKILRDELNLKKIKEQQGIKYVKEARSDLQKLCKVLLQKKLENEDLSAEREALLLEIALLKQTSDQCKEKCKNKQDSINDEIKELDKEIAEFKVRCTKCHVCTDTIDIRKFCIDCPRCVAERDCLYVNDQCSPDHSMDCVCTSVKQKFLDNVFDNMYTVLERQIQTSPGKAVAEVVLNCLKKSRNGKLNDETKKILQDFILTTIKKNLNLTIVGGAVKTRCEMDSETYKQLMLCLKQVKVTKPEKTDQGTDSRKPPCHRWRESSECNCPKGPKECICSKKAPLLIKELNTCPTTQEDKEDMGQVIACPHKESIACGVDCAMRQPSAVGSEVASWKPDPCQEPTCQFKNMRAAQCVLGPEILSTLSGPKIPEVQSTCKCGYSTTVPCDCGKDIRSRPRDRMIEEVMGRYTDVAPIQKVSFTMISKPKHLRAVKYNSCDKNTCTVLWPAVDKNMIVNLPKEKQNIDSSVPIKKLNKLREKNKECSKYTASNKDDSNNLELSSTETVKKCEKSMIDIGTRDKDCCKKYTRLSHTSLEKFILDTKKNIVSMCNKNIFLAKDQIYKAKVIGIDSKTHEPLFALKSIGSNKLEVLLDKEYEEFHKKALNEYDSNSFEDNANLIKTNSGHFIIDFDINRKSNLKKRNALISKTESGNIQLIIKKEKIDSSEFIKKSRNSSIIRDLLDKLPPKKIESHEITPNRHRLSSIKSNSDSNLYEKTKFNFSNKQDLVKDPSVIIKKTRSGQYNLVLSKESKKSLINNVKNYLSNSSKRQEPIKVTKSGIIVIDIKTIKNNKNHNGLLKITPSGNIFASLDEDSAKLLVNDTFKGTCQSISCNDNCQKNSCDKNCDNICYKSKQELLKSSDTKSTITYGNYQSTSNQKIKILCENPNVCDFPEPQEELLKLNEKTENCYHVIQTICPHSKESMVSKVSNKKEELYKEHDLDVTIKDNINYNWNTLEYLPPLLPHFLKDFTYT